MKKFSKIFIIFILLLAAFTCVGCSSSKYSKKVKELKNYLVKNNSNDDGTYSLLLFVQGSPYIKGEIGYNKTTDKLTIHTYYSNDEVSGLTLEKTQFDFKLEIPSKKAKTFAWHVDYEYEKTNYLYNSYDKHDQYTMSGKIKPKTYTKSTTITYTNSTAGDDSDQLCTTVQACINLALNAFNDKMKEKGFSIKDFGFEKYKK